MTRPTADVFPSNADPYAWLEDVVAVDPGRPALETMDATVLSYADLDDRAAAFSAALAAAGVEPSDRVLVQVGFVA